MLVIYYALSVLNAGCGVIIIACLLQFLNIIEFKPEREKRKESVSVPSDTLNSPISPSKNLLVPGFQNYIGNYGMKYDRINHTRSSIRSENSLYDFE